VPRDGTEKSNLHGLGSAFSFASGNSIMYISFHFCSSVRVPDVFLRSLIFFSWASLMPCSRTLSLLVQGMSARRWASNSEASDMGS
jgi:hypothetical protein